MKTKLPIILSLVCATALAQGPLQPSTTIDPKLGPVAPLNGAGAPQPAMRTLYQVEPRTPLVAGSPGVTVSAGGNIIISQPGSYYLTGNVTLTAGNGITINSSGPVTLDLCGFNIATTAAATGDAIFANTSSFVAISNGNIICTGLVSESTGNFSGASFQNGIRVVTPFQATVTKVNIGGISNRAIFLDKTGSTIIDSCTARDCTNGFEAALITNSIATKIGNNAIVGEQVSNCIGKSYTTDGISALLVTNSTGQTFNTSVNSIATGIRADLLNAGLVIHSRGLTGAVGLSNSHSINCLTAVGCSFVGQSSVINRYNMPAP